jgi:putative ABC transport system ATP-binding protein
MNHALGMTQLNIGGIGYVLVKAKDGVRVRDLTARLRDRLPAHDVLTAKQFRNRTWAYWLFGTGVGSGFFISALLGFVVGGAVVGQVLYAMVVEQRPEFGVLKAMGAENEYMRNVVAKQAMIIGVTGYALGMSATLPLQELMVSVGTPFRLFWQLIAGGFLMTIAVCAAATVLPVLKIYGLEPALVFRGEGLTGGTRRARRRSSKGGKRTGTARREADAPALRLRGVLRGFDYAGGRAEVLKGADLDVDRGELVIVAGPSGSGKSTLLCVMGGLLGADAGSVEVFGRDIAVMEEDEVQRVRRGDVGFVFQNIYLMPALTALENVRIASDIKGRAEMSEQELLGFVGMESMARKRPAELSGGERQRVAIARALAGDPGVILADEPTASLDTQNAYDVMDVLSKLARREDRAVVVVTHDVRLFGYAGRMYELEGGLTKEVETHEEECESVLCGAGADISLERYALGGGDGLVCVGEDRAGG